MNNLTLTSQRPPRNDSVHQPYLSFQLNEEFSAAFSMDDVHEVLAIYPKQMTPVFNMPACVLGLLTRRSRILWVVDLSHLLCSQPIAKKYFPTSQKCSVVIIRVNPAGGQHDTARLAPMTQRLLGLIVHDVKGGIQLNPSSIQTPQGNFSSSLTPCLQGSIFRENTLLHVLDASAIATEVRQCSAHTAHS